MTIATTDPRTGRTTDTAIDPTGTTEVAALCERAAAAFASLRRSSRAWRAGLLRALADALDERSEELVVIAAAETGLAEPRLTGEIARSSAQFRLFADAVEEGGYLEAAIDHAIPTATPPAPDVRRMLIPIGPVAVFGSSNFPFAFSVAGGDTASALAGGNPIVIKAHSSHPLTSRASFAALDSAARQHGAPEGTLSIVYGQPAGSALVADPRITAVGFTGSLHTGRALLAIIETRSEPIPFYGELSSINPLIVTPAAARERAAEIAEGLAASVTGSAGQLCTKPGVAFIPRDAGALTDTLAERLRATAPHPLLNRGIHGAFFRIQNDLRQLGTEPVVTARPDGPGLGATPGIMRIDASAFTARHAQEAFGPLVIVVEYDSLDEVHAAIAAMPASLTASLHALPAELPDLATLIQELELRAGRLVFDGYPTGVRVSWAQHHGGPWPATNTVHTSVGVTAIRRFLRPLAWQDAPPSLLPDELRDGAEDVPRRVDGVLRLAGAGA